MNDNMVAFMAQCINTAVMNLLVLLFFSKVYLPKYKNKVVYVVAYAATTVLYIIVNLLVAHIGIPILNLLYTIIYVNVYCLVLFKSSYKQSFVYNFLFIILLFVAEILTAVFCTVIDNDSLTEVLSNDLYMTVSYLINILLMVVIWRILVLTLSKKGTASIKIKQIVLFVIFKIKDSKDGIYAIIMLIGFIFLNIYIVYFIDTITKAYRKEFEYELMNQQNQIQLENFMEINQKYEESRKTIHDIKKHLDTLSELKGIDRERAQEYRDVLSGKVDSLLNGFQCSNQILSIIMSQKIAIAESNNIKINTQIEDILFDFMEDIDITAIFANLWDNAIEACRKVKSDKRFINIIIGKINDFIVICFENSFNGKMNKKGDIILSTKEEHEGVGISIITAAVKKYDGFMNFESDTDTFKIKIMIPII